MILGGAMGEDAAGVAEVARRARAAALTLQSLSSEAKNAALGRVAAVLEESRAEVLTANAADVKSAQANGMCAATCRRLGLDERKFDAVLEGVRAVQRLADPVGAVELERPLDAGLVLRRVSCPIGVVAVVFEARPEVVVGIACLALKSGNAVILKGGSEAERSNRVLGRCVRKALKDAGVCQDAVQLVSSRDEVKALLDLDEYVDLVIPRGSKQLVRFISQNTRIPVMGHADGLCTVYVDQFADEKKAVDIVVDSKAQYPAVCNAAETLIVHRAVSSSILPGIVQGLTKAGVELRCDPEALSIAKGVPDSKCTAANDADFDTEFLELIMAVKIVDSLEDAVAHINSHGSGHTDAIVTEDKKIADQFMATVDSAGVYHNASTRFADGYRYGFGAEVGVSTNRTHARGPVGLDGLLIYKYKLYGTDHTVAPYVAGDRTFLHEKQ